MLETTNMLETLSISNMLKHVSSVKLILETRQQHVNHASNVIMIETCYQHAKT